MVRCSDGTYYTGWAVNVERRVAVHNAGRGAQYTRMRRPVVLAYCEQVESRSEAMRRERTVKRLRHAAKALLAGQGG